MKVRLTTGETGDFVLDCEITENGLHPEVVTWEERVFVKTNKLLIRPSIAGLPDYEPLFVFRETVAVKVSNRHLSKTAAADLLNISPNWFEANVHPQIADKFCAVGEWMYSLPELQRWKHDRDAERRLLLDELTELMEEEGLFD